MGMVGYSAIGGALLGGGTVAGVGGFLKMDMDAESTRNSYQHFAGSGAQALIDKQNQFADATPFTNDEVLNTGRMMLGQGFKAEEIMANEKMVGNVAAGVQTDFADLMRVYAKAKSNVVVQNDILDQFSDKGIPILKTLGDMLNKTPQEIRKMAESGELDFGHLQKAFELMTSKGGLFFGVLAEKSQETSGKLSTFVGTVVSKIKKMAESLNPIISAFLNIGNGLFMALDPVFIAISNLFTAFTPLFSAIASLLALFGASTEKGGLLTIAMQLLAGAINAVAFIDSLLTTGIQYLCESPFVLFLTSTALAILSLGTLCSWLELSVVWLTTQFEWLIATAQGWWAANAAILACPAVWIVAAIAVIVGGIIWMWNNVDGFREGLIKLWEVAKSVFGAIGKAWSALLKGDFSGVAQAFSDAWKKGLANAEVAVKQNRAERAADKAQKVPTAPKLNKPAMPTAPGAGGPGGGKPEGKDGIGKASGLDATTGGTKSTTITINLKSLVERLNINAGSVGEGVKDMEAQVTDTLLRVLNSANSMSTQ